MRANKNANKNESLLVDPNVKETKHMIPWH